MNTLLKQISLWIVLLIVAMLVVTNFSSMKTAKKELLQSDFEEHLAQGHFKSVSVEEISENMFQVTAVFKDDAANLEELGGQKKIVFKTPEFRREWEDTLKEQGISPKYEVDSGLLTGLLLNILPLILVFGLLWFFMFRQVQGTGNKAMSFGKSRARMVNHGDKAATFEDVAGVDEAKEELQEVIEFLKDPQRFTKLGGKIPRGVLLVGPPGSGKTLLARAVAGEASVPFFSISGSDFVEMFVGVGASRVRDLFQQGHKHAPCIIFIDEIDAVGRQRGAGLGGGHDEREQTLNQLLVEMDGFNTNDGVILMAATNRPDVLDHALLRPGRFDRQVVVANPDIEGRKAILDIHIRNQKVPCAADADTHVMARGTPGFSGADLANMVNEAALLGARRGQDEVTMIDFEDAKDRVMMGPARHSLVLSAKEKLATAYHEAGHTLVGRLLPEADPVHKVTIVPRGQALGVTSSLPEEDRHSVSKAYCLAQIRYAMGGRAAEELVYGEFTTGASNDIKRVTQLAHKMVCEWGMSELGPISFGGSEEVFLGRDFTKMRDFSEQTSAAVDREVHRFCEEGYNDAKAMLEKHTEVLHALANELFEKETLEAEEIDGIIERVGGMDVLPKRAEQPAPKRPAPKKTSSPRKPKKESIEELPPELPAQDPVPGTA